MNYVYLTKDGYENLKKELHELKTKGRSEAAQAIAEAREKGDLSENAEYDAAKEAQGLLEKRIAEKEDSFARARIIDESKLDTSKVFLLSNVEIKNLKVNKIFKYQIVPAVESDLSQNKLSIESPIAKGLLGKEVGEKVSIKVPAGIIDFEILSISL